MTRVVPLEWNAFFQGDICPKKSFTVVAKLSAAVAGVLLASSNPIQLVMANTTTHIMMHAFGPLISAIQGLSYPVCFIGMAGGMLLVSVGQRHRGISMIKWAAIGYIGMQLVPGIMDMVSQVGDGIASQAGNIK